MKPEAKKKLLEAQKMAAAEAAAIRGAREAHTLTRDELRDRLYRYVLAKYLLDGGEAAGREIAALAEQSLAKILKIDKALIGNADKSATCDGASSVDMKQALLILAVQKEFDVKLSGIEVAFAETTDDLADLLWEQFNL